MDDQHDDSYEILDLRRSPKRRRQNGAEADSPALDDQAEPAQVIDLGQSASVAEPSPTLPRWQRWAITAAVFIAGAAAGGYGLYASTVVAEESRVEVIALELNGQVFDEVMQSRLYAIVHNAGERDVTVLDLRVPGWSAPPAESNQEVTIAPDESASVVVRGAPACEDGLPESLEADVRTDKVISSAPIPLPPRSPAGFLIAMMCGNPDYLPPHFGIYFNWDSGDGAAETSLSRMALSMDSMLNEIEIVDVSLTAPGFAAQATNLPVSVNRGVAGHLELTWTVSDCAATYDLGSVDVELTLADGRTVTTRLPHWAIAQLARLAVAECGP